MHEYNGDLKKLARALRSNMTDAEKKLWQRLRAKQLKGLKFLRQYIIGSYIVDFYCHEEQVVIEIDGSGHMTEKGKEKDIKRDNYLKSLEIKVFRFNNLEVLNNTDSVMEYLFNNI